MAWFWFHLGLCGFFGRGCEVIRPGLMAEARQRQDREAALGAANQAASLATRQPTHGDNPLHVGLSRVESAASTETCMYEYLFVLHGWITREGGRDSRCLARVAWMAWVGCPGLRSWEPGLAAEEFQKFGNKARWICACMYVHPSTYRGMRGRTSHHVQRNQCKST